MSSDNTGEMRASVCAEFKERQSPLQRNRATSANHSTTDVDELCNLSSEFERSAADHSDGTQATSTSALGQPEKMSDGNVSTPEASSTSLSDVAVDPEEGPPEPGAAAANPQRTSAFVFEPPPPPRRVRVAVRVRPPQAVADAQTQCVQVPSCHSLLVCNQLPKKGRRKAVADTSSRVPARQLRFTFDHVFNEGCNQADIMSEIGAPALDRVLEGYNATVMCYGQSGSGKTHTMTGPRGGQLDAAAIRDGVGLLPRMLLALFEQLELRAVREELPTPQYTISISAVELYNEQLRDLLAPSRDVRRGGGTRAATPPPTAAAADVHEYNEEEDGVDAAGHDDEEEPVPQKPAEPHGTPAGSRSRRRGSVGVKELSPYVRGGYINGKHPGVRETSAGAPRRAGAAAATSSPAAPRATTAAASASRRRPAASHARSPASPVLHISQRPAGKGRSTAVHVAGLQRNAVSSFCAAMHVVRRALRQRHVGVTKLNASSSRAHTLFFVRVERVGNGANTKASDASGAAGQQQQRQQSLARRGRRGAQHSLLTLVDLAGSERVSRSGASGLRLREAQQINLSLSLLGNVVRKLAAAQPPAHIPYRDTKLTQLLQESLGGSAVTFLVCTVSADASDVLETLSTLRFAQLARHVKTTATAASPGHDGDDSHSEEARLRAALAKADAYIAWLEEQLHQQQQQQPSSVVQTTPVAVPDMENSISTMSASPRSPSPIAVDRDDSSSHVFEASPSPDVTLLVRALQAERARHAATQASLETVDDQLQRLLSLSPPPAPLGESDSHIPDDGIAYNLQNSLDAAAAPVDKKMSGEDASAAASDVDSLDAFLSAYKYRDDDDESAAEASAAKQPSRDEVADVVAGEPWLPVSGGGYTQDLEPLPNTGAGGDGMASNTDRLAQYARLAMGFLGGAEPMDRLM